MIGGWHDIHCYLHHRFELLVLVDPTLAYLNLCLCLEK
jgi:hypothetical protein